MESLVNNHTAKGNALANGGFISTTVQPQPPASERTKVLTEASNLIDGTRDKQYGSPKVNFANIAAMWTLQLGDKLRDPLTASDAAILLAGLKLARAKTNVNHRDNYVDLAGYAAIAAELVQQENQ